MQPVPQQPGDRDAAGPVAVWLRRDLRTADHAPLRAAAERGPVFCIYCIDPRESGATPLIGRPRTGAWRARFLIEALADLRQALRGLGGELLVRRGRPEDVLPAMAREFEWMRLYYHRHFGTEEAEVAAAVEAGMERANCPTECFVPQTLVDVDALPFAVRELPEVFTRFRLAAERQSPFAEPLAAPAAITAPDGVDPGALPSLDELGLSEPEVDSRSAMTFTGGATAGGERLAQWIWRGDHLARYKETRNGLHGADYSSKLAPWLAHGCLSPRLVQAEVVRFERERVRNDSTYWLTFELLWRDFFQLVLCKHGARLFWPSGLQGITVPWSDDLAMFERWRTGTTGIPLVDASMRELLATGFLSNRARQFVGSFLTKNLGIDWRFGAEWFESQLIDYDVAANWGNWCYVAGVGNDARGFRYFNIATQAHKYDREGDYVKRWCPELDLLGRDTVHTPWEIPELERRMFRIDYPAPMVDLESSVERWRAAWEAAVGASDQR